MLNASFYSGLAGLQSNATALNVVGNNLANINTAGFKRSMVTFGQVMSDTVRGISGAGNPIQIGLGSARSEIVSNFGQGSIQTTGIRSHLAIQGEGFFQVMQDGTSMYTRAGNFSFNQEGFLVHASGSRVQGFLGTDANGQALTSGGLTDVRVDLGQASPPRETERVRFISNLSNDAATGETYTTSIEVFDSKGVAHQLSLTFTKSATQGEWTYQFDFENGTVSTTFPNDGSGTIVFDSQGNLEMLDGVSINPAGSNKTFNITNLTTGADDMSITWEAFEEGVDGGLNRGLITNYSNSFSTGTLFQDGFGSGILQDITFDQSGVMVGFFDNGQTLELGQVAVATFNNRNGLKQLNGGMYVSTAASGPASVDGEGTGGRGSILANSLESSNVDIAEEFTNLIVYQRGYQSNSKTITTTDQLLQEALNLKR
jgi:flagellar hook protein FlgE